MSSSMVKPCILFHVLYVNIMSMVVPIKICLSKKKKKNLFVM